MSRTMTGARMVVEALRDQGVDTVFGYPGGAVLPIYDELFQQNDITHVLVRHEQGAVHMAEGYARSTGRPGVVLVTSAAHMPRSRWCFEQNGIEVIAAPVGFMGGHNARPLNGWLPESKSFWQNGLLLNEVVGMAVYPLVYRSANE